MAEDKTNSNIADALSKLAATISPFVMLAFTLIAYIYTTNQSDNQDKINEIAKDMKDLKAAITLIQTTQTQHSARMDRQGERNDENRTSIKELEQGQRDLEKTVLLYNANRH